MFNEQTGSMYPQRGREAAQDSAGFTLLEGESFCIGTFRTTLTAHGPFLLVGETVVSRHFGTPNGVLFCLLSGRISGMIKIVKGGVSY